jgi:hypothetical protein
VKRIGDLAIGSSGDRESVMRMFMETHVSKTAKRGATRLSTAKDTKKRPAKIAKKSFHHREHRGARGIG